MNRSLRRAAAAGAAVCLAAGLAFAANPSLKPGPHEIKLDGFTSRQGAAVGDRAVGLMDKGQLSNLITNFGVISNFHTGTPALHWPRNGTDVQHYSFGVSLLLLADGQMVKAIPDPSSPTQDYTWEAADGSMGRDFNATRTEENTAGDEVTPLLASSDRPATWPVVDGEPHWPGWYRENLDNPGQQVEGEFTSDRDIYAVLEDKVGLGLRVEQVGYSYSRPYAEDLLFVRYRIHNEGGQAINEAYLGLMADLKPDFFADDRIDTWKAEPGDAKPSFIFKQDLNGVAQRDDSSHFDDNWVGPVGWIGMGLIDTPDDAGITSFHYFHDDFSPVTDGDFAALMTNHPSGVANPERYFHGPDSTFDDIALQGEIDQDALPGSEPTFVVATGPFTLAVGDSTDFSLVFAIGADSTALRRTVDTAYLMGRHKAFQGSGPPATPYLKAEAGDGQVLLTWDADPEASVDAITGVHDFEGYRLYKSTDGGLTWGEPLTNWFGQPVGYVPLFQCDLVDSVTGLDPAYGPDFPAAHTWLGDDTGLRHSYIDRDVTNGLEVWYTLTSYDRGRVDSTGQATEPSYESPRGISAYDQNTVAVVPGTPASNRVPGMAGSLTEVHGKVADGLLDVMIVDDSRLTGHSYQVTFNDSGDVVMVDGVADTARATTLNLRDLDRSSYQFTDMLTGQLFTFKNIPLSGDALPEVDGFRLLARNIEEAGMRQMGWTHTEGDSSTFDWWVGNRAPGNPNSYEEVVIGADDWRVTITDSLVRVGMLPLGFGDTPTDSVDLPLKIEISPDASSGNWTDVTEYLWLSDLALVFVDRPDIMGPLGWDLVPGGAGYNPNATGDIWPDILVLRDDANDSTGSLIYLKTQNGPDTATPPSVGDQYTMVTYKPFDNTFEYEFTTEAPRTTAATDLASIKVVPNPYIVRSGLETDENDSRLMFTHLPAQCDITIYTVAGQVVDRLEHRSTAGDGFAYWDVRNKHGQDVAYGVYVYVVKTPGGKTHTGKLMVIR